MMPTDVPACFLESTAENLVSVEEMLNDGLAFHPVAYADPWNGFAVPIVTCQTFADFIGAHAHNDRGNGTWGEVLEVDLDSQRYLVHAREEWMPPVDDDDRPRPIASVADLDGADYWAAGEGGLYALDGWVWLTADQYDPR